MWRDFPFVVALVGVGASIASFIALMEVSSPGWGVVALQRVGVVLVALAVALALAVERRATAGAWQAQIAAAAVSVAFVIVALVKLYTGSSEFGGLDQGLNWAAEAQTVGLGALALGLIGLRVTTSASWIASWQQSVQPLAFPVTQSPWSWIPRPLSGTWLQGRRPPSPGPRPRGCTGARALAWAVFRNDPRGFTLNRCKTCRCETYKPGKSGGPSWSPTFAARSVPRCWYSASD